MAFVGVSFYSPEIPITMKGLPPATNRKDYRMPLEQCICGQCVKQLKGLIQPGSVRRSTSFSRPNAMQPPPESFLTKALGGGEPSRATVINTDEHAAYPPAIVELKAGRVLEEKRTHRPVQYLNNVLEQDHRTIKRRVRASQHFRSFLGVGD
jgi:hypothetical protein